MQRIKSLKHDTHKILNRHTQCSRAGASVSASHRNQVSVSHLTRGAVRRPSHSQRSPRLAHSASLSVTCFTALPSLQREPPGFAGRPPPSGCRSYVRGASSPSSSARGLTLACSSWPCCSQPPHCLKGCRSRSGPCQCHCQPPAATQPGRTLRRPHTQRLRSSQHRRMRQRKQIHRLQPPLHR